MTTYCAWCRKLISGNPDTSYERASHNICKKCYDKLIKPIQEKNIMQIKEKNHG